MQVLLFRRPYGTRRVPFVATPPVELAGYFHKSLRDFILCSWIRPLRIHSSY
jgi:hypothetical protein